MPAKKVLSVYDPDDAETIENGIEATGADTHGEALAELARAYTGWEASDSDDEPASGKPDYPLKRKADRYLTNNWEQ